MLHFFCVKGGTDMYCPYCGNQLNEGVNFCPNCGAPVEATQTISITANQAEGNYRLILISRGTCTKAATVELLEDLLGYSETIAAQLYANMPVEIAEGLTEPQARYTAQAFAEYGVSVSIYDQYDEYVELQAASDTSVYNSDGSLITAALAVLAGITAVNRVNSFRKYKKPGILERLFKLAFQPKQKPVHVRRSIYRAVPQPARHPVIQPQRQIIREPERKKKAVGTVPKPQNGRPSQGQKPQGNRSSHTDAKRPGRK